MEISGTFEVWGGSSTIICKFSVNNGTKRDETRGKMIQHVISVKLEWSMGSLHSYFLRPKELGWQWVIEVYVTLSDIDMDAFLLFISATIDTCYLTSFRFLLVDYYAW